MVRNDLAGGLALIGFAAVYALAASNLSMTSSLGIGSGLFPMMLAGILCLLGLAVTVQSLRRPSTEAAEAEDADDPEVNAPVPVRGVVLVTAAPVLFALLVVPLGVAPALGLAVFVSALASRTTTTLGAFGVAAIMVVFCLAVFRWALGLPLQMVGPWLSW